MTHAETLAQHHALCDEIYRCVFEENRFLRQHQRAPEAALLESKRTLLARLDETLAALRALPAASARETVAQEQLERTRARILQILQLDKENEQLLLRCSLATARAPGAATLSPSLTLLQKIYARKA